jgi:hypothetical protein
MDFRRTTNVVYLSTDNLGAKMAKLKTHNNIEGHSKCVRCKIPLESTWGKPHCGLCKRELDAMHAALEYTMFRKTYYTCSTEGTSLEWLLKNGYGKDIILPTSIPTKEGKAIPRGMLKHEPNITQGQAREGPRS